MTKLITPLILLFALVVRVSSLGDLPPSMYWEEVALGYDAYSIWQTGADHHGNPWPLVAFESFGDWKPSLYFYSIVPMVAIFGLDALSVRLPSALAGVMIVLAIMKLSSWWARQNESLPRLKDQARILGWLAGIVAALSPWLIIFSRGGWEANLATALIVWGVYFGLAAIGKQRLAFGSAATTILLLIASMYAYHSARIIAPLLGLSLLWWWFNQLKWASLSKSLSGEVVKWSILGLLAIVMILPLAFSLGSSVANTRFAQTSIFSRSEPIELSNQLIEGHDGALWARLLYHRNWFWLLEISTNYLSHFDFSFLYIDGDQNPRHSIGLMGLFYPHEALAIVVGLGALALSKSRSKFVLGWWLLIGVVPSAISEAAPHALRTLPIAPVLVFVTAFGWWVIYDLFSQVVVKFKHFSRLTNYATPLAMVALVACYLLGFAYFLRTYTQIYPVSAASHWQYGYQEAIMALAQTQTDHPTLPIYLSNHQGRPLMYYWFYTETNPRLVQAASQTASKDQSELLEFENIRVIGKSSEIKARPSLLLLPSTMADEMALVEGGSELLSEIKGPNGNLIWQLWRLE